MRRNPVPMRLRSPFIDWKLGGKKGGRTSTWTKIAKQSVERDKHRCQGCGVSDDQVKLTVDHIIPLTCGGRDELRNTRTLCTQCHVIFEQAEK